jgi:hypothetical protein
LPHYGAPAPAADFAYAFRGPRARHRKGKSVATTPSIDQVPAAGLTRNDLSPEQRAVLLRRTRKAEQVLGEELCETEVERHIIEPVQTSRTIVTRASQDHVTDMPDVPEYDRRDCEPQLRPSQDSYSQARAAVRALAAFGFGEKQMPSDLRVYVQKERQVAETIPSPVSATGSRRRGSDREDSAYKERVPLDERRHHRAQLAKVCFIHDNADN